MADPNPTRPDQYFDKQTAELRKQLRDLQRLTGTQKYQSVERLEDGLADLQANLPGLVTDSVSDLTYSKSVIDGKLVSPGDITPTSVASTGPVSGAAITGSSLSVTGAVSGASVAATAAITGASITSSADLRGATLYATGAPSYNITGTRVAGWWESATGRAGTASSSRRFKQDIVPADIDVNAVLAVEIDYFHYINEVRKRDDPTYDEYVGSSYHVSTEVGVIAEELHRLGLWQFVVYQRHPVTETRLRPVLNVDGDPVVEDGVPVQESYEVIVGDELTLGDDGEPIADGVHYELLALALFPVVQQHESRIAELEQKLTAITAHLSLDEAGTETQ